MNKTKQLAAILLLLLSACALLQSEYERVSFALDPGWKVGNMSEIPRQISVTEFIREGDNIKAWKELFTVQTIGRHGGSPSSPEEWIDRLKAVSEKDCPGVKKWNVIARDETSILYEWQAKPCLGWPDQHEIARIILGKYNSFHLRYKTKV